MRGISSTKKKILLLFLGGLALSLNRSPKGYFKILHEMKEDWREIGKDKLYREIRQLHQSKAVSLRNNPDGTIELILTEKGKRKALRCGLERMKILNQKWDGKWRLVVFDIPESRRNVRNALRGMLKRIGFYELQKSVFVHPYECKNEIQLLVEFFKLNKNVRYGTLLSIDNDLHLKNIFRDLLNKASK
jgi:CRISPR-associated endonuclease Cas2